MASKEEILGEQMKVVLANIFVLYLKAHHFHWIVEGPNFMEYHKLFEKLYDEFWTSVDDYAEHIRALGEFPVGTCKRFLALTDIQEASGKPSALEMVQQLADDNQVLIESLNKAHDLAEGNGGILNFIEDRLDYHAKIGWFLKATLS